jgi:hypothetical protein
VDRLLEAANDTPIIESLVNRISDLEGENRFVNISSEDTVNIVKLQTNKNTSKVTESHVRMFVSGLQQRKNCVT